MFVCTTTLAFRQWSKSTHTTYLLNWCSVLKYLIILELVHIKTIFSVQSIHSFLEEYIWTGVAICEFWRIIMAGSSRTAISRWPGPFCNLHWIELINRYRIIILSDRGNTHGAVHTTFEQVFCTCFVLPTGFGKSSVYQLAPLVTIR